MSTVTPTILSQGQAMDPTYEILSVDVRREVNRIPRAEIHLADGNAARQRFPISDADLFEPGREIEIKLRYEGGDDATVFKGMVVRHAVEASAAGSVLAVEIKDAAVKLTGARHSAVFRDQTDGEIIGGLVEQAGLRKGSIAATRPKHAEIVQYYSTDWDFMLARAEVLGLLVVAADGEISLAEIELEGAPRHTFEWGISEIYDFEMEADAGAQFAAFESVAWSLKDQKLTPASTAKAFQTPQGNLDPTKIAKTFGYETYTLSHPAALAAGELQAWADARMATRRMAMLRGRLAVAGLADVGPLDLIEVAGIGERFNGRTLVTGVRHRVDRRGWQTDLQFGLSPEWFCRRRDVADCPAAGLLPAARGLRIGVIAPFEEDPEKEYRAKVLLPGVDDNDAAVWARLASPEAGKERGYFFRPEEGDEVLVGFLNDDPRQPVVLGSLYGSRNRPPAELAELSAENFHKGIVTRKGTTVAFDDERAAVRIETPGKNKIVVDDDAETIETSDQHGNSLTLSKDGVTIKSAKDVIIDAGGNVEIKGKKVDVK